MNPLESRRLGSDFQKAIELDELNIIVNECFPQGQQLEEFTELKSGRFNTTYKIKVEGESPVILRIAPEPAAEVYSHEQYLLRREHDAYPSLASVIRLAPKFLFTDFSRRHIGRDYALLSYVDGKNWGEISAALSPSENLELWKQLSDASSNINKAVGDGFGFPNPMNRSAKWSGALAEILDNMIRDLDKYSIDSSNPQHLSALLNEGGDYLDSIGRPQLVHGDLWPKNVIIDETPNISGVLDHERAFWGDPKAEWIMLGDNFAGQVASDGNVFRCGLFSADFAEMPATVAKQYEPKNDEEFLRQQAYLGIYLTQRKLESQRFPRSEPWIDEQFSSVLGTLRK